MSVTQRAGWVAGGLVAVAVVVVVTYGLIKLSEAWLS